jgi:hypothetical protein
VTFINFLLTERKVFTEKYRTEIFFEQTEPVRRGLYKKTEVRYFSVKTEPFIGVYTWNKQDMHALKCILVAMHTFGWRKQKLPMYSFLST